MRLFEKRPKRIRTKPHPVDGDDRVVVEILCVRCGGSLRSQVIGERCARCLHPVSDSVFGDYLVHADRGYVRSLADAARFVRIGAGFLGAIIAVALVLALFTSRGFNAAIDRAFDVLFAGGMISPLIAVIGLITLTSRRSFAYYRARYRNRRRLVRLWIVGGVSIVALVLAILFVGSIVANLLLTLWITVPLATFLSGLASVLMRVPNKMLATFARLAHWGAILGSGLIMAILTLRGLSGPQWIDARTGCEVIAVIFGIAGGIALYRLLLLCEHQLERAAR